MFGAAVGVRRETHFSFPTLADAAPPLMKAACKVIARLAMLALGVGLAWFGAILAANSWNVPLASSRSAWARGSPPSRSAAC